MQGYEYIELARAYVALSNAHAPRLVNAMFADDAVYVSANVGQFSGKDDIHAMMTNFFARFPDVHWRAENFRNTCQSTVQFDFVMTGTERETGAPMQRASSEALRFCEEGYITRIEVY